MRIAIHQPNFMPWYPFFQKMAEVDVFVIMGHCQFEKNNYQNRFHVGDQWNTMSVNKGLENIVDKRYVNPQYDWMKIKKRLTQYNELTSQFDEFIGESLFETNTDIIRHIRTLLRLPTEIVSDDPTTTTGTKRLIELIRANGGKAGDVYLAGSGAQKYMEPDDFRREGIHVVYQEASRVVRCPILEVLKERNVR